MCVGKEEAKCPDIATTMGNSKEGMAMRAGKEIGRRERNEGYRMDEKESRVNEKQDKPTSHQNPTKMRNELRGESCGKF